MRARRYGLRDATPNAPPVHDPIGRQHRIPRGEDEVCIHPRRAIKWNRFNNVYQCCICGHILYDEEYDE